MPKMPHIQTSDSWADGSCPRGPRRGAPLPQAAHCTASAPAGRAGASAAARRRGTSAVKCSHELERRAPARNLATHRPPGHARARPRAGLLPAALAQVAELHAAARRGRRRARPARAAVVLDRQRRLAATSTSSRSRGGLDGGTVQVLVAVADVDALVGKGSPIDAHARTNTTSVYTAAEIFPMLPEKLSTDLTSLADRQDRLAVVVEMTVGADGSVTGSDVYRAAVRNHAKLAYDAVAAWLEGDRPGAGGARRRSRARREPPPAGRGRAAAARARGTSTARSTCRRSRRVRCSRPARSATCAPRNATAPRS